MNFRLGKKQNMVVIAAIVALVVVLSQARLFDMLTETALGRLVLLSFVVFLASLHKIAGLVGVLVVMVAYQRHAYSVHSYNFYEGFEVQGEKKEPKKEGSNGEDPKKEGPNKEDHKKEGPNKEDHKKEDKEPSEAKEGFCLSDKESNMLRGKQSNSVPVPEVSREQHDDVSPSSKSFFTSDYASV